MGGVAAPWGNSLFLAPPYLQYSPHGGTFGNFSSLKFPPPPSSSSPFPGGLFPGRKTQKHPNKYRSQGTLASMSLESGIIPDYTISRVPHCLSPHPNWVRPPPFPRASVSPPNQRGGQHSPAGERLADPVRTIGEKAWHSVYSVHNSFNVALPAQKPKR